MSAAAKEGHRVPLTSLADVEGARPVRPAAIAAEMKRARGTNGDTPPDAPAIVSQALQAQLGLRLDSKKVPVEMLIVDHVEREPLEN